MALQTVITTTDDIDGTEDAATYRFGYDKQWYEIDLGEKNAAKLQKFLDTFVPSSRKVKIDAKNGKAAKTVTLVRSKEQIAEAREWARQNGFEVKDRGRLSAEIWTAFDAAE